MTVSATQVNVAVLGPVTAASVRATRVGVEILSSALDPVMRATQINAAVMGTQPKPQQQFTQVTMQILALRTPLYEFTSVILADVFPFDISYNSVGSTRFATDVIVVDSGDDQRVQRWAQPLMEYDVAYGVRTMEQLMALVTFFRAMRGRFYAFNYRDNVDYTSSVPTAYESRAAPPISCNDQIIGTGDGVTYAFQLTKTYATLSQTQVRPINRPEPGTVSIGVNGAAVTNWAVDTNTGVVTFNSAVSETYSHTVTKDVVGTGAHGHTRLTGEAGDFTAFGLYGGHNVLVSGFSAGANNTPLGGAGLASIAGVAPDGSWIDLIYTTGYGAAADTAPALTLALHPAPVLGSVVTAGYHFFVPCRFDTDTLPTTIEDYGVGSSNNVKLIEVRPNAWS